MDMGLTWTTAHLNFVSFRDFSVFLFLSGVKVCASGANGSEYIFLSASEYLGVCTFAAVSHRALSKLHMFLSPLVFSRVITVNQLFVHGHKTREKEHRYASGAPH